MTKQLLLMMGVGAFDALVSAAISNTLIGIAIGAGIGGISDWLINYLQRR